MAPLTFITDKHGLDTFYEAVIRSGLTYAPVERSGKYVYEPVSTLAECHPDSPIGQTNSIKPLFFPRSSRVMSFSVTADGTELTEPSEDPLAMPRVILGVKHCDARALQVLDKVYSWDYVDAGYLKRREHTLLISPRCTTAGIHCFCTSLDYDVEHLDALDVAVVYGQNDKVYLQSRSEKGEEWLQHHGSGLTPAGETAEEEMKRQYIRFAASFRLTMNYPEVHQRLQERFDSPLFEELSATCIGCNACAFVCPTCHCFKITDEKVHDQGIRYKNWDSCNNGSFTLMAGGHNPRPERYRRWRQRSMHKFVYYKERFDMNLCVGCGKCATACPVRIHIFDIVHQLTR